MPVVTTRRAEAAVYALDPGKLADFYCAVAEMVRVEEAPGFVALQGAALDVILVTIREEIAASIVRETPPQRREETPIKLVLLVHDLAAARDRAAALGGVVDPCDREWSWRGLTRCDGHDPEGNVFQLAVPI